MWRVQPCFPLLIIVNLRGRGWIEKGTISKKELALDDLGESRPVQIPKDATGRKCSLRMHAVVKGQGKGWIALLKR